MNDNNFEYHEVFDEKVAERRVREFLIGKYPANQGVFNKKLIHLGIKALRRQHEGLEIGALERAFSD